MTVVHHTNDLIFLKLLRYDKLSVGITLLYSYLVDLGLPSGDYILSLIIIIVSTVIVTQLRSKRYIVFDVGHDRNHLLRLYVLSTNVDEHNVFLILEDTIPYRSLTEIREESVIGMATGRVCGVFNHLLIYIDPVLGKKRSIISIDPSLRANLDSIGHVLILPNSTDPRCIFLLILRHWESNRIIDRVEKVISPLHIEGSRSD